MLACESLFFSDGFGCVLLMGLALCVSACVQEKHNNVVGLSFWNVSAPAV